MTKKVFLNIRSEQRTESTFSFCAFDKTFELPYPSINRSTTEVTKWTQAILFRTQFIAGKFNKCVYDQRDDFSFPIAKVPFYGNINLAPSYGVFVFVLALVTSAKVILRYM